MTGGKLVSGTLNGDVIPPARQAPSN